MTTEPVQYGSRYQIRGHDAASLRRSVERGIARGTLAPGDRLPSVRALATELGLSPGTVASAYRDLRQRGAVVSHDRARTVVAHRRSPDPRLEPTLPPGCRDLASGNPDPDLLPTTPPAGGGRVSEPVGYGGRTTVAELTELARAQLSEEGLDPSHLAVTGGGLDGIERVLLEHCRPGDRVVVEDPGYVGSLDLVRTLGLEPVPVALDDAGPVPESLAAALDTGVEAAIIVPRAQNPTGAAITPERAVTLRALLDEHAEVVVIEDDHLAPLAEVPLASLTIGRPRWVSVRSLAKAIGPDLRLAVVAGDPDTIAALEARQRLGPGWTSRLLQALAADAWRRARDTGALAAAASAYAGRRSALLAALDQAGIDATGTTGLNVWIPVVEEVPVAQGLLARGWAVQAGEPFRIVADPGVRVTIAGLPAPDAPAFVADLLGVLERRLPTRRG